MPYNFNLNDNFHNYSEIETFDNQMNNKKNLVEHFKRTPDESNETSNTENQTEEAKVLETSKDIKNVMESKNSEPIIFYNMAYELGSEDRLKTINFSEFKKVTSKAYIGPPEGKDTYVDQFIKTFKVVIDINNFSRLDLAKDYSNNNIDFNNFNFNNVHKSEKMQVVYLIEDIGREYRRKAYKEKKEIEQSSKKENSTKEIYDDFKREVTQQLKDYTILSTPEVSTKTINQIKESNKLTKNDKENLIKYLQEGLHNMSEKSKKNSLEYADKLVNKFMYQLKDHTFKGLDNSNNFLNINLTEQAVFNTNSYHISDNGRLTNLIFLMKKHKHHYAKIKHMHKNYLLSTLKDKEYNNVKSAVNIHRDVFGSDHDLQGLVNNTAIGNNKNYLSIPDALENEYKLINSILDKVIVVENYEQLNSKQIIRNITSLTNKYLPILELPILENDDEIKSVAPPGENQDTIEGEAEGKSTLFNPEQTIKLTNDFFNIIFETTNLLVPYEENKKLYEQYFRTYNKFLNPKQLKILFSKLKDVLTDTKDTKSMIALMERNTSNNKTELTTKVESMILSYVNDISSSQEIFDLILFGILYKPKLEKYEIPEEITPEDLTPEIKLIIQLFTPGNMSEKVDTIVQLVNDLKLPVRPLIMFRVFFECFLNSFVAPFDTPEEIFNSYYLVNRAMLSMTNNGFILTTIFFQTLETAVKKASNIIDNKFSEIDIETTNSLRENIFDKYKVLTINKDNVNYIYNYIVKVIESTHGKEETGFLLKNMGITDSNYESSLQNYIKPKEVQTLEPKIIEVPEISENSNNVVAVSADKEQFKNSKIEGFSRFSTINIILIISILLLVILGYFYYKNNLSEINEINFELTDTPLIDF